MKRQNSLLLCMLLYHSLIFNAQPGFSSITALATSDLKQAYCGRYTGIPCKSGPQGIYNGMPVSMRPYDSSWGVTSQQKPHQTFEQYTKVFIDQVNGLSSKINNELVSCSKSIFAPFVPSFFVPVPEITTDMAVEQLNTIDLWANATDVGHLGKGTIDLLRNENPHFNNLVSHLIAQRTDWCDVRGSNVDEFFDWKTTYSNLSSEIRTYVRGKVFEEFREKYGLADDRMLTTLYQLAHHNSQGDKQELGALYSSYRVKHNKVLAFLIQNLSL